MKLDLNAGELQSRSVLESAQRCLNMYTESVDGAQGEPAKITHLPTPGLTLLSTSPTGLPIRCLYRASNGYLFAVSGQGVYSIDSGYVWKLLGTISARTNPAYMADNGVDLLVVDGSTQGVSIKLATLKMTTLSSSGWLGSDHIDYIDGYFLCNFPSTPTFFISDNHDITFDPSQFSGKSGYADLTVAVAVAHHVIYIIGTVSTEVWYNSGGATTVLANTFPLELLPGTGSDRGCAAPYSIAKCDGELMFISRDNNGHSTVLATKGYGYERISTHGLEHQMAGFSSVADAVGYSYQQEGHNFFVLSFPSADRTFVYDASQKLWHERCSIDANGIEHAFIAQFHAFFNGLNIVGDASGRIYSLDLANFTENGAPVKRIVSFPRQISSDDDARVVYKNFIAEISGGESLVATDNPLIQLQFSDDRGKTWSQGIEQSLGRMGQYSTFIKWNRLGMSRNRVFRLVWAANAMVALQGAWTEVVKAKT